ncbi:MAG: ABC transporter ATP-binding protein, partial [Bacillota bacterium]|nr:ABC transporter ATP-binding protein [Bacillota bacterium]
AELHRLMAELREEGTTLILSTHDMAEAEEMADRVAILLQGEIVAGGSPRQLTAAGEGLTKISVYATDTDFSTLNEPEAVRYTTRENYHTYYTTETGRVVSSIISHIEHTGGKLIDLRVERPSLEERFLELTNREVS